jgi:hypothetical protein
MQLLKPLNSQFTILNIHQLPPTIYAKMQVYIAIITITNKNFSKFVSIDTTNEISRPTIPRPAFLGHCPNTCVLFKH